MRKARRGDRAFALSGTRSQAFWLVLYFAFNLGLTLYNKGVLFHQVVRAATPIFTTLLSTLILGTRLSAERLIALAPVMFGVVLATYGDYSFTYMGLLLTLLGAILAALKTIYTNVLQSRTTSTATTRLASRTSPSSYMIALVIPPPLNLHPLDLLARMSPLALVQCVGYAYLSGEFARMRDPAPSAGAPALAWWHLLLLLINGCIAFGLNVVSFTANGKVGALNMTVAANVKQVLTIVLAVAVFNLTISRVNAIGIMITLLGGAWYAGVEYRAKAQKNAERLSGAP
ncbi:Solute carrier family 35 member E1 [Trametes pubescens]|uniref:Solute carrier family 35 member E1 n=1 Tax=Trametes pubescens TaxID=154538 RepID=A0A1M2V3F9_TRAPU|nr:Solute carrier family 35 member E1 [Trametes pubescens]